MIRPGTPCKLSYFPISIILILIIIIVLLPVFNHRLAFNPDLLGPVGFFINIIKYYQDKIEIEKYYIKLILGIC